MDSVTFGNITKSITGSVETIGKPGGLSVTGDIRQGKPCRFISVQ